MPHARVVPLSASPATYTAAVERYPTGAGIAKSSARTHRISLTTRGWMFIGVPAPTDPTGPHQGPAENQIATPWRLDAALREKTGEDLLEDAA
ncbi:hypothetical protein GCM10009549_52780 [Streptomyces thermoalcalitolerans]|uniref:Uncharacterized protein n=1 Tax=Streptomyces thermoalcalitolerans TaxID=65605 RepID=A0ABP4A3X0_9ACTN